MNADLPWECKFATLLYTVTRARTTGAREVTLDLLNSGFTFDPDEVRYLPPPFNVVGVTGLRAAAFSITPT